MPYNLRRRPSNPVPNAHRRVPIPRHGDRVTIFWNTLGTSYTGTLTRYDPIHATFLVFYDSTPSGFDDHRIWEALDLVPWRLENGNAHAGANDVRQWFQPGELGNAHPRFRAREDSESSASENEEDEEIIDGGNGENGSDDNGKRNDQDDSFRMRDGTMRDDNEFVKILQLTENEDPMIDEDEPRRASRKMDIAGNAERGNVERAQAERAAQTPEEREMVIEQREQAELQDNYEEDVESDDSFRDSLYHPPLAPTSQSRRGNASQSARQMNNVQNHRHGITLQPENDSDDDLADSLYQPPGESSDHQPPEHVSSGEEQAKRAQTREVGITQQSRNDSDDSMEDMEDSVYQTSPAARRRAPKLTNIQPTEHPQTQAVPDQRRGAKRQGGYNQESMSDSENGFKDSLSCPPLSADLHPKRRKRSDIAQRLLPQSDRKVRQLEEMGNYFQLEQKQKQSTPLRPSQNGSEHTSEDSLYRPPLAPQRETKTTKLQQHGGGIQPGPARASGEELESACTENPYQLPVVSSQQALRRNTIPLLQSEQVRGFQHRESAPHNESEGIFDGSLFEPFLAPKRKERTVTPIQQSHHYRPRSERKARYGEQQETNHEIGTQQEPADNLPGDISKPSLIPYRQGKMEKFVQDTGALHFEERRKSDPAKGSTVGARYKFKEDLDRPPMASQVEPSQPNPSCEVQQQARNLQAELDPLRRRRYANFGTSGFTQMNRVRNVHPTQQSNGTSYFYPQDTVHVDFSRELQPQKEGPSNPINHGAFRVSTGYHVPHSDVPSVEDQIKSITKTLGVMDGTRFDK